MLKALDGRLKPEEADQARELRDRLNSLRAKIAKEQMMWADRLLSAVSEKIQSVAEPKQKGSPACAEKPP